MKSTASSNSFRTIIRDNFRKYWVVSLLGTAYYLIGGFLPYVLAKTSTNRAEILIDCPKNESFLYIVAILTLGVGSGAMVFSYLQNVGSSNYMHGLPLKRSQLFAANVISGLLMIAGPILLNCIMMSALSKDARFLKWAGATAICCFAIFGISAFAAMLSGNSLMHLFNTAFFSGFVSVFMLVFFELCATLLPGYAMPDIWMSAVLYTNPLSGFIGEHTWNPVFCAIYLLIGATALLLAWRLYLVRKVERTGESLMFKWERSVLYLYCVFVGAVLTGLLFSELLDSDGIRFGALMILGILVGALMTFVIGSVLIDRTSKIFTRRNLIPTGAALLLALCMTFGLSFDVFGYGTRVPAAEDIETVYLNTGFGTNGSRESYWVLGMSTRYKADYYDAKEEESAVLESEYSHVIGMSSPEAIDAARDLHQAVIDRNEQSRLDPADPLTHAADFEIIYKLKNGTRMHRSYTVSLSRDEYDNMASSDIFGDAVSRYFNSEEFRTKYSLFNLKPDIFGNAVIFYYPHPFKDDQDGIIPVKYNLPHQYAREIRNALEADYQACTFGESQDCTAIITVVPLEHDSHDSQEYTGDEIAFPIPNGGTHMKAWLKQHKDLL